MAFVGCWFVLCSLQNFKMETFFCPEQGCGRKFSRRYNLNRHYQNFHLNSELVEKCSLCGQLFESCEKLQKHYRFSHRPSRKFFLKESAFKKAYVTYRYNFLEKDVNFASSQLSVKEKIKERLMSEVAEKTVCKASLIFIAEMVMNDHSGNKLTVASIPFRSPAFLITNGSNRNLKRNILKSFSSQTEAMEEFIRSGSNWTFERALAFDIEIAAVRPITGGKETENEKENVLNIKSFRQKKFLYNPCNKDEKCFLYCIAHFLYQDKIPKTKTNLKKTEQQKYKKFIDKFKTENIQFPISISGIKKFLNKNKKLDLKINILYRNTSDKIFPHEFGLGNGSKIVNLLMVEKPTGNHFLLIKDADKYLRKVYKAKKLNYKKEFFCLHCFNSFSKKHSLMKHEKFCSLNKPKVETVPEKGSKHEKIRFKNYEHTHKLEYTAYLDFECVLPSSDTFCEVCQRLKCTCDASFTEVISKQKPIAFSFLVLGPNKEVIHEHSFAGKNAHVHLVRHLLEQENLWIRNLLSVKKDMIISQEEQIAYEETKNCYICQSVFSSETIKVRDHSHYSGLFLGAACQSCNLRRRNSKKVPIFMHNGSRFDLHFIVKALAKFGDEIKNLSVLPYNQENFRTLSFNSFEFVDSLAFLQASLAQLASDLKDSEHNYSIIKQTSLVKKNARFNKKGFEMVLGKSFFPYEFCGSLKLMYSTKNLPKRKHFYSQLSEKSISKGEYKFAKTVWEEFKCENLVDYTLLYCKIDVLILSELFETFRDDMIEFSGLDPAHYISLPAYSYDSMLKTTKSVIELPTDIDMVHFLESGKRGGMSIIRTRHLYPSTSNDLSSGDSENDSEIIYIDANVRENFLF